MLCADATPRRDAEHEEALLDTAPVEKLLADDEAEEEEATTSPIIPEDASTNGSNKTLLIQTTYEDQVDDMVVEQ